MVHLLSVKRIITIPNSAVENSPQKFPKFSQNKKAKNWGISEGPESIYSRPPRISRISRISVFPRKF